MKLILLKDVLNLGQRDEVVNVKPGFAQHYLLPQKLAKIASDEEVVILEKKEAEKRKKEEMMFSEKRKLAEQLSGKVLEFRKKIGIRGKIFGSVTAKDIQNELATKLNIKTKADDIILKKPIKEAGEHKIIVKFGKDIETTIKVIVEGQIAKK